jgi:hypothetical protein
MDLQVIVFHARLDIFIINMNVIRLVRVEIIKIRQLFNALIV